VFGKVMLGSLLRRFVSAKKLNISAAQQKRLQM
jgi:hypothetical protein